jgi:alanyl-tRNA synthetase
VGDIGLFKIIAEGGVASGIRRIEAITGDAAVRWVEEEEDRLHRLAQLVKAGRDDLDAKVAQVVERNRKLEKELEQLKSKLASAAGSDLADSAVEVNGARILAAALDGADPKSLRDTLDQLKNKLKSAVILLAAVNGEKVSLVAGVTGDLTDRAKAGDLVKLAAEKVGGRGGGRPDMAQAGGNDPAGVPAALEIVEPWARERLG